MTCVQARKVGAIQIEDQIDVAIMRNNNSQKTIAAEMKLLKLLLDFVVRFLTFVPHITQPKWLAREVALLAICCPCIECIFIWDTQTQWPQL